MAAKTKQNKKKKHTHTHAHKRKEREERVNTQQGKKKKTVIEINSAHPFDDSRVFISRCIMPITYRIGIANRYPPPLFQRPQPAAEKSIYYFQYPAAFSPLEITSFPCIFHDRVARIDPLCPTRLIARKTEETGAATRQCSFHWSTDSQLGPRQIFHP